MYYGTYRTKTYIAADWTGDKDAVDQLYKWNNSNYWALSFTDAHDVTQARDGSLNCSIKSSLKKRLDISKTFVLIVGNQTKNLRSGYCSYCPNYNQWFVQCTHGYKVDNRSYIDYECAKAVEAGIKIVVLYNAAAVDRSKCPDILKDRGNHVPMRLPSYDGQVYWNYQAVKNALS